MSEMDDIFDIRELVERHGDKNDKEAWANIEKWLTDQADELNEWRKMSSAVDELAEALTKIAPKRVQSALAKCEAS